MKKTLKQNTGFTLVELLVTLSIIILFTVGAVTYNRSTEFEIAQYTEQGRIINLLNEARSLAISTYNRSGNVSDVPCGYGIHIPSNPNDQNAKIKKIIIFKDMPKRDGSGDYYCPKYEDKTGRDIYDDGEDVNAEVVNLKDIYITSNANTILFVPPDPQVYTNGSSFPINITIHSYRVSADLNIYINNFGQISYE